MAWSLRRAASWWSVYWDVEWCYACCHEWQEEVLHAV